MDKIKLGLSFCIILIVGGIIIIILGGALNGYYHWKTQQECNKHFASVFSLSPHTNIYKRWIEDRDDVTESFYFFNVTNPMEAATGAIPRVEELEPIQYRIKQHKTHVDQEKDGKSLSYTLSKKYMEIENQTYEDFNITTANVPILALASLLRHFNETIQEDVERELERRHEELFVSVSVKDLLWGYENQNLEPVLLKLEHLHQIHPMNVTKFGLLYRDGQENNTRINKYSISTGSDDISKVYQTLALDDKGSLSYWTSVYSNTIKGSNDARSWSPHNSEARLFHFNEEWCRDVFYDKTKKTDIEENEPESTEDTVEYSLPAEVLEKSTQNSGFCTPAGHCMKSGVLNATVCRDNFPIFLSQPHFYQADKNYSEAVEGLNATVKHKTSLSLEPKSGFVTKLRLKMQYNVEIKASGAFNATKNFHNGLILPIAYKETTFDITQKELEELKKDLADAETPDEWYYVYKRNQWLIPLIGGILVVSGLLGLVIVIVVGKIGKPPQEGERRPLLTDSA